MVDVDQLIRNKETQFVEQRTKTEIEINKFLESIKDIEEEIKDIPGKPTGTTAKEIVPSLWTEPFDEAKYKEEIEALKKYVDAVVAYGDRINEEALKCLQS